VRLIAAQQDTQSALRARLRIGNLDPQYKKVRRVVHRARCRGPVVKHLDFKDTQAPHVRGELLRVSAVQTDGREDEGRADGTRPSTGHHDYCRELTRSTRAEKQAKVVSGTMHWRRLESWLRITSIHARNCAP